MYIEKFRNIGVSIKSIMTYRDMQIRRYMVKEQPDITRQFDIQHVGKNIKKVLFQASKFKECEELKWSCESCNEDVLET